MRTKRQIVLFMTIALLLVGCSDEAKDDAAQLEKDLAGDSMAMVDSVAAVDSSAMVEAEVVLEPEVVEEPTKMMPKKPAGDGYTVQVAGCEDSDYALHLVEVYTSRGYEPFVTTITVEGETFHRVRIGIFAVLSDAKALQSELNDKYSIDSWIDVTMNDF